MTGSEAATYRLTVGPVLEGKILAIITQGGHPQIDPGKDTLICAVRLSEGTISDLAWFEQQVALVPWEQSK